MLRNPRIVLLLVGAPVLCLAQPAGPAIVLPETVVTANRGETAVLDTPFALDALGGEEIRMLKLSRSLPETLQEIPSVLVQKTGHGQGSPYIRGFTGFRNLLLVDGVRVNNSVFREGPNQYWNTVDAFAAQRLELIKGPGSVLYGSDAVGGTLNLRTYDLDAPLRNQLHLRGSTAERSGIGRLDLGTPIGGNRLEGGVTWKDFGDIEGGRDVGRQRNTSYGEFNWDARMLRRFDEDTHLVLSHQGTRQNNAPRTHKTVDGIDWEGLDVGGELRRDLDQERMLTALHLRTERLEANLSWQRQAEERDRVRSDGRRDLQGFDLDTLGAHVQLDLQGPIGAWRIGAEVYRDEVDSHRRDYRADGSFKDAAIQGPVADDASYLNSGAYIEHTLPVRDRIDLVLGGRYSYFDVEADRFEDPASDEERSLSRNFDAAVGSARAVFRATDEASLFAGVSQGFRAPNLSDLTRLDSARSNEIETPSPEVDPERFVSFEIGAHLRRDGLRGEFAYYYTDIDDLVVRTPTGREIDGDLEVTKRNAGGGHVQGVELSGGVDLAESWNLRGAIAWQDGEADTYPTSEPLRSREPISRLMPTTGFAALRFAPAERWWIEATLNAADKADRLSSRDKGDTQRIPPGGTPGYAVVGLRGGYEINDSLALTLSLGNIADEDYRVHGSGVNESGRNLIAAVRATF